MIRRDYRDRNPLFVCPLKGAFIFGGDLIRAANIACEVDFVRLRSYQETESSGVIDLLYDCESAIEGRHVVVVDDIVDTGTTTSFLLSHLRRRNPATLRICVLLDKPSRRRVEVNLDYVGFIIPNVFVVGYGLDYEVQYRYLQDMYALAFEEGDHKAEE